MARYFFDSRDRHGSSRDDEGVELDSIEAVRIEAAKALADMAKGAVPKHEHGELWLVVRDESGRQVIRASLSFAVHVLT